MGNLLKRLFKTKQETVDESANFTGDVENQFTVFNNYIDLVHDSCSICYNRCVNDRTYEDKLDYIRRRAATGHESIFEHSNFINYYVCDERLMQSVLEALDVNRYLHQKVKVIDGKIFVLLGGSIRGYKHIVRNIENPDNKFYNAILESMYSMNSCFFGDFIEEDIMEKSKFLDLDNQPAFEPKKLSKSIIRNMDNIHEILKSLQDLGAPFTFEDLLPMCTITINFTDVSRIITQQLTRHRDTGITQASQRYINYSDGTFNSPDKFKPEKYEPEHKYEISFGNKKHHLTLQQLGDEIIKIYPQLIKHGLLKEDARAYLPMNVGSSLYMTFNFKGFIKFLELREEKHAQIEIQLIAKELGVPFREFLGVEDIFKYLEPKYKTIPEELEETYDSIDEVIED